MKKLFTLFSLAAVVTLITLLNSTSTAQLFEKTPPTLKLGEPLPANLFVELAKAINPSVVNISTSQITRGRSYRDPMIEMLEQFYGMPLQPREKPGKPRRSGLGTGFIVRADGLIITNNHVIEGADLIEVQLTENSEKTYKAEIIGRDERTDIALIKIKPDVKLTAAVLGNSTETQVGEWVAAFGNPYGHGHTMTKGIISSKGREIEEINKLPLLQTDASINPGNSGGPLVNSKGLVIGVNSAIDARAQGIGFAIPIDEVKKIIPQLEKNGSLKKGYLGIYPGDLDDMSAQSLGLPDDNRGAVIMGVGEGPAKKAGLKTYDIILEINSKKIKGARDLMDTIADLEPGSKNNFKVLRNEKKIDFQITISERPSEQSLLGKLKSFRQGQDDGPKNEGSDDSAKAQSKLNGPFNLGAEISPLTDSLRQDFKIADDVQHPIITEVARGTVAQQIGLKVGDLVMSVNKTECSTVSQALKAFKKGSNTMKLARGRSMIMLTFDLK